ncbi:TetR/AcrR family transcriptional regulator [Streptomyces sp. NBC_00201]|uniref:TetR/AcrR family transcriptional regulator n=1 Tax=unclassified Streptomyces TaxID=2593676 RepID=UPI0022503663|nr:MULTISPECIES: TetR/AcrR family transcriptional regulator [unclassified Streptomyces]MCX5051247.1 TetR/AcrR family transcriptional regulator [Streptomyces sp. NBC_00474]MCX5061586.1 TetR/AcrR family transcriptional regulator [Streptomyces sp. NBC_00452]MCX5249132.1 TetR/AcrR family transcriptional regulator [Streptomyces sp. NBC_00201]MCX5292800.1 TetR/AcrR family transcriptional regulator [Streptomyces sp. NBC_00183]
MGHREDLLEGAKRCLLGKGFVRTTARDIVKESGTNLASIGYHYGSKDALLVKAYVSLIEGLGETFDPGWGAGDVTTPAGSLERFQEVWANIIRSLPESRSVWMLSLEIIVNGDRLQEVRKLLAEAQEQGRSGIVPMFNGIPEDQLDKETVDTEGRFYQTLLNGLMVQWLFDPDSATGAEQLTEGLRRVLAGVELADVEKG